MAVEDKGSTSRSQETTRLSDAGTSSPTQAPPAPPSVGLADALLAVSSDPISPRPPSTTTAMAETEEDHDLAVASIPADPSSTGAALPAPPPLGTHLIMPTAPPPPPHQHGIAWKLATFPFYLIGGGMGVVIGTLRLSAWAVGRALSLLRLGAPEELLQLMPPPPSAGSSSNAQRLAPVYAGDKARLLPRDVLMEIALRLRSSRQDVQSMRSVCPEWRAVVPNTNGPWLVLSRRQEVLPPETQRIAVLQMLAPPGAGAGDAAGGAAMEIVPCFSAPPSSATCWGAAHGLVALRQSGANDLYLFCLICGSRCILPPLTAEMTAPCGIFFNEHPLDPLAILTTTAAPHLPIAIPRLHFQLIDPHDAQRHRQWVMWPGTETHVMRSVAFDDGAHFIGATSTNMVVINGLDDVPRGLDMVVIDEADGPPGLDMVFLDVPMAAADQDQMVAWGNYGHHVFKCSDNIYFCLLLRGYEDVNTVRASVFLLQLTPAGYSLVPTNDIGGHSVYLGVNKPVVLPAEDGSLIQRRNTIYIADDDGVITNGRVLCIDLGSHEVSSIPFPNDVSINDYGHASWVAAPPLNGEIWHMWHCNGYVINRLD